MKFLSIIILNIALISGVQAAEQVVNETKQPTSASTNANAKGEDKNSVSTAENAEQSVQKQSTQQYSVLKTQFLGKRPYMEKSAR